MNEMNAAISEYSLSIARAACCEAIVFISLRSKYVR